MDKKNIALICGAGAVSGSWLPILDCLTPNYFKSKLTADGANSLLASLVYNLRFHGNLSNYNEADEIYKKCKEILNNTRNTICESIKDYQEGDKLNARKEFNDIIEKMILPFCKNLLLITTNWDTVIDEALENHPILKFYIRSESFCTHLHGSFKNPNTIYLPTEFIFEKYRTKEQEDELGNIHAQTMKNLKFAQTLIIYGLSFSPLDAELLQVFGAAMDNNENLEVVKIIDPVPHGVAEKINILLRPLTKIKVEAFLPADLNNPITLNV